ncbi:hypothetical protein K443DRAFT_681543 [Laccaria amethystina LaAM-08-1]|jgi:hypothetical protein|uniref:Uncharacterized protein n=1 Tax=Laccaria amethystina LaAM-08-1 TaxID=1095629 RepID=A0A0C9XIH1_9AGAR|nr:hypothetical protein K443DRAFT_681543 [Laccaria amethystina LaAM-08-1]
MIVACGDESHVKKGLEVVCGVVSTLEEPGGAAWRMFKLEYVESLLDNFHSPF